MVATMGLTSSDNDSSSFQGLPAWNLRGPCVYSLSVQAALSLSELLWTHGKASSFSAHTALASSCSWKIRASFCRPSLSSFRLDAALRRPKFSLCECGDCEIDSEQT